MPELPEVETIRLQLDKLLLNKTITAVSVLSPKNFIGDKKNLVGRKILSVKRRAKVILMELDNGDYLAIHLKMTGQLIYRKNSIRHAEHIRQGLRLSSAECPQCRLVSASQSKNKGIPKQVRDDINIDSSFPASPSQGGRWNDRSGITKKGRYDVSVLPNIYTRVIISLNKGKLYFNDLRKFGWIKYITLNSKHLTFNKGKEKLDKIIGDKYGPEPFDKEFTEEYLKQIFSKTKKPVKLVLLDQERIAGIGNIYGNEVLFKAGILPMKPSHKLSNSEIKKLRKAIIEILTEAIKNKGTSDKDEAYRQSNGEKGSYQNYLAVYGRKGEKCPKCHGIIKRIKIGGRGTFYCSQCQI